MNADLLVTSDYLRAVDLVALGPQTVTIERVVMEEMDDLRVRGKKKQKGVIYFKGKAKGWVINTTNKEMLKQLFGGGRCANPSDTTGHDEPEMCRQTDHWIGRRITLHAVKVRDPSDSKKKTDGIEVKGTPDLTAPLTITIKPNKRAGSRDVTFLPTGGGNGQGQRTVQQQGQQSRGDAPDKCARNHDGKGDCGAVDCYEAQR